MVWGPRQWLPDILDPLERVDDRLVAVGAATQPIRVALVDLGAESFGVLSQNGYSQCVSEGN